MMLTDVVLFPLLQVAVIAMWVWCLARNSGGVRAAVTRGPRSLEILFGTYAGISAILVAVDLVVSPAHRVLWVLVDTIAVYYICVLNPWFRNKLIGMQARITTLEAD